MQAEDQSRESPQYPIESVDRALRLLLMFQDRTEIRLSAAREALGVGQSTAHRLMAMLVYHGFAIQDPTSRVYRAGPTLLGIGLAAVQNADLPLVARPTLEQLAQRCGETVHLGMLEGGEVRFVDGVESELALRVTGRVGRVLPAYATSIGKAMLAALPDKRLHRLYPDESLRPVTAQTNTSRSALLAEIEQVRATGFARNAGESEEGVGSVGAALVHPGRGLVGGISIAAPLSRLDEERYQRYGRMVLEAAAAIVPNLRLSSV